MLTIYYNVIDCQCSGQLGFIFGGQLKLYVPIADIFFSVLKKKTELDYDTGIFMRLWNVKNVVSAVLCTIIQLYIDA
jgi:hypothetical protein